MSPTCRHRWKTFIHDRRYGTSGSRLDARLCSYLSCDDALLRVRPAQLAQQGSLHLDRNEFRDVTFEGRDLANQRAADV